MKLKRSEYKFLRFEKSKSIIKKYDAILENKKTGQIKRVPFGHRRYEQYRDSTPLKLYKNLDHNDKTRLENFQKRFESLKKSQKWGKHYTPLFFSWTFLW